MHALLKYALFDVILAAGLPVGAAYLANWVIVKRFQFHDYLGDGQLCFYATTLGMVTISDLLQSRTVTVTEKFWALGAWFVVILPAAVVWGMAITARIADPATAELSKRRITKVSLALASAAVLIGGIFKWLLRVH